MNRTEVLAALAVGQVVLLNVARNAKGEFKMEFAERIQNPNQSLNVLAILNEGDEKFKNNNGVRHHFANSITTIALEKHFGIKPQDVPEKEALELNILNPKLLGQNLRIQIEESFEGTEYQMANQEKTAKQYKDKEGKSIYFVKDGKLIFSSTRLVTNEPKHQIIQSDAQLTWEQYLQSKVEETTRVTEALNA